MSLGPRDGLVEPTISFGGPSSENVQRDSVLFSRLNQAGKPDYHK